MHFQAKNNHYLTLKHTFLTHKGIHVQKHFQLILKTPRMSKKTKKPRKPEKNNRKNRNREKKPIKPIKILKKPTSSVSVL